MTTEGEDLIDYEEEEEEQTLDKKVDGKSNGAAASSGADAVKQKGSYVGVHSTGFRDLLLKPELNRSIVSVDVSGLFVWLDQFKGSHAN